MMLAPSASTSMSTTVLGDTDMTLMRVLFRQAAGRDRDELLRRSADGNALRPLHRLGDGEAGDAILRDADRIAALSLRVCRIMPCRAAIVACARSDHCASDA